MDTLKLEEAALPPANQLRRPNLPWAWPWWLGLLVLASVGGLLWMATQPLRAVSVAGAALDAALESGAARENLQTAVAQLEAVAAEQPDSVITLRRLTQGYVALNRPQDALRVLEQAASIQPDSPLIDHERAVVHAMLQQDDPLVWAELGHDATSLAALGDRHLAAGSPEALLWYRTAQALDANLELGMRWDFAQALSGDPRAVERGLVHGLEAGKVQIAASELRWLVDRPQLNIYFGTPLGANTNSAGDTATRLWWSGPVASLVRVDQAGRYRLSAQVRQVAPAPVIMALGLANQPIAQFRLEQGDESAVIISTDVQLERGTQILTLWFLNDGVVDGVDRNAWVEWMSVELTQQE